MSSAIITKDDIVLLVKDITTLSMKLPKAVPKSKKSDRIYEMMTKIIGEGAWQTFNRRFDILFGEDCWDGSGRLIHVQRGTFGMDAVCKYLSKFIALSDDGALLYDLVKMKLDRILRELQKLVGKEKETDAGAAKDSDKLPPFKKFKIRAPQPP
ncbi:hypothetical protein V8D89_012113 [Ganoderma adspersum]